MYILFLGLPRAATLSRSPAYLPVQSLSYAVLFSKREKGVERRVSGSADTAVRLALCVLFSLSQTLPRAHSVTQFCFLHGT